MLKFNFNLLIFLFVSNALFAQIKINEIQPTNTKTVLDSDYGKSADWIELYNTSTSSVNVGGYYLSDDASDPRKWVIPAGTSIASKGYLLIWADSKNNGLHTNFKLSADGEKIRLFSASMLLLDTVTFGALDPDVVYGRKVDGTGAWAKLSTPTPGKTNIATVIKGMAPKVAFSVPAGFYSSNQTVALSSSLSGAVIRYTIDGSEPTASSTIYSTPIIAKSVNKTTQKSGNNRLNKTGIQKYTYPVDLSYPTDKYKDTRDFGFVIKAKVFHPDYVPSYTNASTYFIDLRKPTLPVISMSTDFNNFFSADSGIYIQGTNGATEILGGQNLTANWYQDWERKVFVEYFDANGTKKFGVNAGVQTMGAVSRNVDMKSLVVAMKSKYEEGEIEYPLFGTQGLKSYSAFVLRNSGNDWEMGCMARDAIIQSIVRGKFDIETQAYQPVVMFLNGEYWGLINMRERYDADYFSGYTKNVDADEIDLLKRTTKSNFEAQDGDTLRYKEMVAYLKANTLATQANYEYVKKHYIDIDNFINYLISQLYCQNTDWPANNVRIWRPRQENGKFRFPLYDTDFGYGLWGGGASSNAFSNLTGTSSAITSLYNYLMLNSEFKADFIQRYLYLLNTVYTDDRLLTVANDIENTIATERDVFNDAEWTRSSNPTYNTESMISWGTDRIANVRGHIDSQFGYKGLSTLTVNYTASQGTVYLASLPVNPGYSGQQYKSTNIRLKAVPSDGYQFLSWKNAKDSVLSTDPEFFLKITTSTIVYAVFQARPTVTNIKFNELLASNETSIVNDLGVKEDWIELHNAGSSSIDIAGLYISDKSTQPTYYKIPYGYSSQTTIPAGGFLVLWADGQTQEGVLHLPFKLTKDGDTLLLSQKSSSGTITTIDNFIYGIQNTDISYGRYPDANTNKIIFSVPTPGVTNTIQSTTFIDGLIINEFMAKNSSTIQEETGGNADYIEIYNSNSSPVDVAGLFVTNDLNVPNLYMIPKGQPSKTTIPANGYYILWADKQTEINPNHLSFNLNASKGDIAIVQLRGAQNYIIDKVSYSNQGEDISYGIFPVGSSTWKYMVKPTPGAVNKNDTTIQTISGITINECLSLNTKTKADENSQFDDYIEFYNGSSTSIDLGGLFVSDTVSHSLLFRIPRNNSSATTVAPGKWLTFWADKQPEQGSLHLDFQMSSDGEEMSLSQVTQNGIIIIDTVTFGKQTADVSYGRFPEKSTNKELMAPSYNAKNTSANDIAILKSITSSVGLLAGIIQNNVYLYKILLPEGTVTIPILSAESVNSNASVSIVQAKSLNDVATITVISPSGLYTNIYTVSFGTQMSTDATLKSLSIANSTISPAFSATTFFYTATTSSVLVPLLTAIPTNSNAFVSVSYASNFSKNTVITVTAESGDKKDYTISYLCNPTAITQWTDNFDDNVIQNVSNSISTGSSYILSESGQKLTAHLVRAKGATSNDYFMYKIPEAFVLNANPTLYVSFDAICTENKLEPTNTNIALRVEVVDNAGHTSDLNPIIETIAATKTTFNLDLTDVLSGALGDVDKSKITAVRFYFEYLKNDKDRDKTAVFDNLVIGPLTPSVLSSNANLATLVSNVGTLSPVFAATTSTYTLTLPAGTTAIPTISATVAQANATIQITQASKLDGTATVRVIAQDKSTIKIYSIKMQVTPTLVEGYIENIVRPDKPGWTVDNSTYSILYNAGAVDVTYNRTATSGNDAITFNLANEASKILNLTTYPYFAIKAKTSTAINLRVDYFDVNGNITNSSPVIVPIKGTSDSLYVFTFTNKFSQLTPTEIVDVTKIYGVKLYFDAGSTTAKTGTVSIDKLLFGSEVTFALNYAPVIASIPSQSIMQGQTFSNILLNSYVTDDHTSDANLKWTASTTTNVSVTITNNIASIVPHLSTWLGTEIVTFTCTDEAGEKATKTVAFTVTELKIPVTSVSFVSSTLTVGLAATLNLKSYLQINPIDATIVSITWESDNTNVTVDANGVVTNNLTYGTEIAKVTATVVDKSNNSYVASTNVQITGCDITISQVTVTPLSSSLTEGKTLQLVSQIVPANACVKTYSYSSTNALVATVSQTGLVTAASTGTVSISVSYNDGFSIKSASSIITVTKDCSGAITLALNKDTTQIVKGQNETLTTTITPVSICTTGKNVTWKSTSPSVASVVNGVVTALSVGQAQIIASTDGTGILSDTCTVIVLSDCYTGKPTLTLDNATHSLYLNDVLTVIPTVIPSNTCDKTVTWLSDAPTIASVINGVVTAKNYGDAIITCSSNSDNTVKTTVAITVLKRLPSSVSIASTLSLVETKDQTLTASILPANSEDNTLTWQSLNPSIATVDPVGNVIAIKQGTTKIVVSTVNGLTDTCDVIVSKLIISVKAINVGQATLSLIHHDTSTILVTFDPLDATNKNYTIASSNPSIITLNGSVLSAEGVGNSIVTVTSEDGGFQKTIDVTVTELTVKKVTLDNKTSFLDEKQSITLKATVSPVNATYPQLIWKSLDPTIASVGASGIVTANSEGIVKIVVSSSSGISDTCTVTVSKLIIHVDSVKANSNIVALKHHDTYKCIVSFFPNTASNVNFIVTSSQPTIVSTSGSIITAENVGNAIITITSEDGNKTDVISVTVSELPVSSVFLDQTSATIEANQSISLSASIEPLNATTKTITWNSSNNAIATVDVFGKVSGVAAGDVLITATAKSGVMAVCSLKVNPVSAKNVNLDKTTLALQVGESKVITATVLPAETQDKTILWTSLSPSIATVSSLGVVMGIATGTATIKATATSGVYTICDVTVSNVIASTLTLNKVVDTLIVNQTETLSAVFTPQNTTNKLLTWTSSNDLFATVSSSGLVTAKAVGDVVITAKTSNGVIAACSLHISPIEAQSILLDITQLSLNVGDIKPITATVLPIETQNKTVSWLSLSPSVATVSADGVVTGKQAGSAVINATTANGIVASCVVVVKNVLATTVTLNKTNDTLFVYDSDLLTASFLPTNTTDKSVNWTSSNTDVVSVNNGAIKAIKSGYASITASSSNNVIGVCYVVVKDIVATSINATVVNSTMDIGTSQKISVVFSPTNVTANTLKFESSNPLIATVDNSGLLIANTAGDVDITVTTSNGISKIVKMKVNPIVVASITLNVTSVKLLVQENQSLIATINPSNASDKTLQWSALNSKIATVDQYGKVTAVAVGTTTISVSASNGISASCDITVVAKTILVESVTANSESLVLNVGMSQTANATILPADASNKSLVWTSNILSIATVDQAGLITAKALGQAKISVTSSNGISDTIIVYVVPVKVQSITASLHSLGLGITESQSLSAQILPLNASDKSIKWTSQNANIASITSNGVVTGNAAGTTYVYAVASNNLKDSCKVIVNQIVYVADSIKFGVTALEMNIDSVVKLNTIFYPSSASNKSITWTYDNPTVVTVDVMGNITAIAEGTVTVTATTNNGKSTSVIIIVLPTMAQSIQLSENSKSLDIDDFVVLYATVLPVKASNKAITWTTENKSIATVDQVGLVTAITQGTTYIVASTDNGIIAKCEITVNPLLAKELFLSFDSVGLGYQKSLTLEPIISPSNVSNPTITWKSSNTEIATVDANGVVKAVGYGKAVITATTVNGVTANCIVVIDITNNAPQTIAIPEQSAVKGKTFADLDLGQFIIDDNTPANKILWSANTSKHISMTIDSKGIAKISATDAQWTGTETVSIYATDEQGLTSNIDVLVTVKTNVFVEDISDNNISVYPNPSNGIFLLKIDVPQMTESTISIYNELGEKVYSQTIGLHSKMEKQFDFSERAKGIYFVEVTDTKMNVRTSLIIQ